MEHEEIKEVLEFLEEEIKRTKQEELLKLERT